MHKTLFAAIAAAGALMLAALACTTPDVESGPATAQAMNLTVIAGLTQANIQLTPDDSQVTQYAGFLETQVAEGVNQAATAQQDQINASIAATVSAGGLLPTITAEVTEAPPQTATGSVTGKVCYPSSFIPPMTIFAKEVSSSQVYHQENGENQATYNFLNLPAGNYYMFAYTHTDNTPGIGIGYTQFVICGLQASCSDHTMIAVPVDEGEATTGIDICDGYDASAIPPMPPVQ